MAPAQSIPLATLEVNGRQRPPAWAVRQRQLMALMERAAQVLVERYTRADGTFKWREEWAGMHGTDNAYEIFLSFPLFYLLGGGDRMLELAQKEWDALTWQFTEYGTVYREFVAYFDWFHHSESYTYLFYLGLADPAHHINRRRALNFAAMYIGEDEEAQNWDAERRMMRSPINGSKSPRIELTIEDWANHRPTLARYLVPYEDFPGLDSTDPFAVVDWNDDEVFEQVLKLINQRMVRGDVPLNLSATTLVTHAYLYTGEAKYKQWVLDYVQAWVERKDQNNGIMPDNVGPTGRIGECMNGKWWGGYYGWRWPHGSKNILEPTLVAGSNAMLLTGDASWLDLHRSQLDLLWSLRREENGRIEIPARHGAQGFFDYRPPDPFYYIHLYYMSQSQADLARLDEVFPQRQGFERQRVDWPSFKGGFCPPNPWFMYMEGNNPGFPQQILEETCAGVYQALERIETDAADPEEILINYYQKLNPVVPEGLVQMAMGTPAAVYNGGLLHTHLCYFDPSRGRPGLPEYVAALVDRVESGSVALTLVSTDPLESRRVLVQAGMFGEHEFERVELEGGGEVEVNGRHFQVRLGPSAQARLRLGLKRFEHRPCYGFPAFA